MQIDIPEKFWLFVGRVPWARHRFGVEIGIGYRPDAEPGEIVSRHYFVKTFEPPRLLRRDSRVIGLCAFGRCWVIR